jgi:EmrB/QacA subfamily drug resistance transporter
MSAEVTDDPTVLPDEKATSVSGRLRTIALVAILLGFLLDLIDITVVNVALPSIQRGIGADGADIQWIVAIYTLAFALALIPFGRLGDIIGRKRVFLIGIAGFTVASLLAGMAQTPEQLIAVRFLQGAMGAAMVPQVYALIQVMYAPAERGRAFAGLSGVLAIGAVGGPLIGAILTDADIAGLGWRSVFLVNIPLGIFAFIVGMRLIPESKSEDAKRLDLVGVVMITIGLLLLIYPVVQGRRLGWPAWTFASMLASLAVLTLFVLYERRRVDSPLVAMSLFRHRSFNGGLLISFFFMGGVMAFFLYLTLYLQVGQGYSVLRSGVAGLPWDIAVPLFGALSARVIAPKLGRYGLQLGLLLLVVSMVMFIWLVRTELTVSMLELVPSLFLGGVGMGLTFAQLMGYALHDVPVNDAGSASGVLNAVYQVGVALGIAACGTLFFTQLGTQAASAAADVSSQLRVDLAEAGVASGDVHRIIAGFDTCFVERMKLSETLSEPASCTALAEDPAARSPQVAGVLADAQAGALRLDYQRTIERTVWSLVGLFTVAIAASFLLPRRQE